jgi:hypothetical protein
MFCVASDKPIGQWLSVGLDDLHMLQVGHRDLPTLNHSERFK